MIQRYYRFLRLKASQPFDTLLIPTIDIEIVWQTHLLRPDMYRKDCLRLFRRVIDHSLILNSEVEQYFKGQAFIDTCQLYEQTFDQQYCRRVPMDFGCTQSNYSYWDRTEHDFSVNAPEDYENPFSFIEADILLDLEWLDQCTKFMSNAVEKVRADGHSIPKSAEIDLKDDALKRLKKSYEQFLYMAAKYPLKDGNGFIPPTCAVRRSFSRGRNIVFLSAGRLISFGIRICKNH